MQLTYLSASGYPMSDNEWVNNAKYVLLELKRLNECALTHDADLADFRADIVERLGKLDAKLSSLQTELTIKSGMWGILGGAVAAAAIFIAKTIA